MKPPGDWEWGVLCLLALLNGLLAGIMLGWNARSGATNDRYVRSLAEQHEARARYWDTQAHDIITNNTLERNKRDGKKTN